MGCRRLSYDHTPKTPLRVVKDEPEKVVVVYWWIELDGETYAEHPALSGAEVSRSKVVQGWLLPDPAEQFSNPYLAMGNNPVMYVDPDGEWVHIVVGAVVGGAINLATNWDNIDNFGEGLAAFGAGAASGALTMTLGPGGAALGGAIVGATNSTIAQTGNGVGLSDVNWGTVAGETVLGAASGFAGGYVGGAVSNGLAAKGIGGVINGAASGFAGGFTGGFVYGSGSAAIRGDGNILQNGFKFGLAGGVGGGIVGGIAGGISTSKDQNIWNGKSRNVDRSSVMII